MITLKIRGYENDKDEDIKIPKIGDFSQRYIGVIVIEGYHKEDYKINKKYKTKSFMYLTHENKSLQNICRLLNYKIESVINTIKLNHEDLKARLQRKEYDKNYKRSRKRVKNQITERKSVMKKCPDEKKMVKKSDLKKMRDKILKEDRKEDDKRYAKKSVTRQSSKRKK